MVECLLRLERGTPLQEVMDKIDCTALLADFVRFVDPVNKTVIELADGELVEKSSMCFSYWSKNAMCRNCVSMRAFLTGEVMMKLEYNKNTVNMLTAVPVCIGEKTYVVEMFKDVTERMFFGNHTEDEGESLRHILEQAGDVAVKDGLTGVYNRRFINEQLPEEIRLSRQEGKPLSVIMMDIDNFKSINDTWGHKTGDIVLTAFAGIVKGCLRKSEDWVARYGGDEFAALLWDTGGEEALQVARRMRTLVAQSPVKGVETALNITASFGVYTLEPGEDVPDILQEADRRLYQAKQAGRNGVAG